MNKKIISLLLVCILMFSMIGCGKEEPAAVANENQTETTETKETSKGTVLDDIKSQGKIVLGTSADYPPYEWHAQIDGKSEIVGFDIELAQDIAKELGVELEISDMKFNGILPALTMGDVDIAIAGMVVNEERKEQVDFSEEYYAGGQSVLIRAEDAEKYKTKDDFEGAIVAAQMATIQEDLAKELEGSEYEAMANLNNMVLELKGKAIDAIVIATPPGTQFAKMNPELKLIDVGFPNEDGMSVAVAKGNEDLVEIINGVISKWKSEGKVEEKISYYMELSDQTVEEAQ